MTCCLWVYLMHKTSEHSKQLRNNNRYAAEMLNAARFRSLLDFTERETESGRPPQLRD